MIQRLSRPYMKSQLTIEEIMTARRPIPDPVGIPRGLCWDVPGTFRGSEGAWELIIHPETNMIYRTRSRGYGGVARLTLIQK